jgi:probable HAF family extracellular repeat protein
MKNAAFALTLSWWIGLTSPCFASSYTVIGLGPRGVTDSVGYGINNSGQVVGTSDDMGVPCLFVGGTAQPIGDYEGTAFGINDSGQIVGQFHEAPPFLYSNGTVQPLAFPGTSGPFLELGAALGINNNGDVVGQALDLDGDAVGFLYNAGVMHNLGPGNYPAAINDQGQMAGTFANGFFYSNGISQNPATFPGVTRYTGLAINEKGEIAGFATFPDGEHAFAYTGGVMHDLGLGRAYGINERGQVVGDFGNQGFLYSGGSLYYLSQLFTHELFGFPEFFSAYAINDAGQITGSGGHDGVGQAFLLTPIPEPSSLVLSALGLIGLVVWRRRRG